MRILLDDGESVRNVPRNLKSDGHRLLGLKQAREGYFVIEVKKGEV